MTVCVLPCCVTGVTVAMCGVAGWSSPPGMMLGGSGYWDGVPSLPGLGHWPCACLTISDCRTTLLGAWWEEAFVPSCPGGKAVAVSPPEEFLPCGFQPQNPAVTLGSHVGAAGTRSQAHRGLGAGQEAGWTWCGFPMPAPLL